MFHQRPFRLLLIFAFLVSTVTVGLSVKQQSAMAQVAVRKSLFGVDIRSYPYSSPETSPNRPIYAPFSSLQPKAVEFAT